MVERTFEAIRRAHAVGTRCLMEHPEDLGVTSSGEVPASIWRYPDTRDLQAETGSVTWALFQCVFLALTSKPTRLMSDLPAAKLEPFQGWPSCNASMECRGPLPHACPHGGHRYKLIGKAKGGGFRTSPSASYPPEMCRWLALFIVRSFFGCETLKDGLGTSNRGVFSKVLPAQVTIEEPLSEDDESQKVEAASDGCQNLGPPLNTFWDGRRSEFSDGFGLCYLGRGHPFKKGLEMSAEATSFCKSLSDVIDKHMGIIWSFRLLWVRSRPSLSPISSWRT